jgi:hypothetical protein
MRKGPALVRIKFFLLCENVFWTPMLYHACMHNIVQLTFRGVWGEYMLPWEKILILESVKKYHVFSILGAILIVLVILNNQLIHNNTTYS